MSLKKHESALTIEEQVNNLKSLNLIIKDEQLAKDFLNDISYFRFISMDISFRKAVWYFLLEKLLLSLYPNTPYFKQK